MAVDPSVLAGSSLHRQECAGGKIVPKDEPTHLLILRLDAPAVLECGRKPMTELDIGTGTLLMAA